MLAADLAHLLVTPFVGRCRSCLLKVGIHLNSGVIDSLKASTWSRRSGQSPRAISGSLVGLTSRQAFFWTASRVIWLACHEHFGSSGQSSGTLSAIFRSLTVALIAFTVTLLPDFCRSMEL